MASRAILRGKRSLFSSSSHPRFLIHSFSSYEDRSTSPAVDPSSSSWDLWHPSANSDSRKERGRLGENRDNYGLFSSALLRQHLGKSPAYRSITRNSGYALSLGFTGTRQHMQLYSSTATAGQSPERGRNDQNEEATSKVKEPSPEECDQAVEGLSSAKAKAKKLQESQKGDISILQRVWATILGIGPALRAVASMSREDWAIKLRHWKSEIISTLQHYWLVTKLLWADVRISLRLLLKLAEGKSLSRRERQQLTRTTADIFRKN